MVAARTPANPPGERLGRYELLERIASGGMGEVFVARSVGASGIEKRVVIKRILPQYAANDEFVAMFLDEARVAVTLHHANIVQTFDVGCDAGRYFIVMEPLDGFDLRALLAGLVKRGQRLGVPLALQIASQALAALHYAHDCAGAGGAPLGIVHRDVSPGNLFVGKDGVVKLLDFGIARTSQQVVQTRSGVWKGKFHYMSPEQCHQAAVDRRSDVFALGAVLWEMLVGRRLYHGETELQIVDAIASRDAPAPSAAGAPVSPEVDAIVLRALARDPLVRWQTAEQLQLALDSVARREGLTSTPHELARLVSYHAAKSPRPRPEARRQLTAATGSLSSSARPRRGLRWAAALIALVICVGIGAVLEIRMAGSPARPAPAGSAVTAPPPAPSAAGSSGEPAIKPIEPATATAPPAPPPPSAEPAAPDAGTRKQIAKPRSLTRTPVKAKSPHREPDLDGSAGSAAAPATPATPDTDPLPP